MWCKEAALVGFRGFIFHSSTVLAATHGCLPGTVLSCGHSAGVALWLVPGEPAGRWRHQVGAETMRTQRDELSLETAPWDTGARHSTQIFLLMLCSGLSGKQMQKVPESQPPAGGPRTSLRLQSCCLSQASCLMSGCSELELYSGPSQGARPWDFLFSLADVDEMMPYRIQAT